MSDWISVEDQEPVGNCLVILAERSHQNIMHTAYFSDDFSIIGGHFAWDMPRVTHWMSLPQPPKED